MEKVHLKVLKHNMIKIIYTLTLYYLWPLMAQHNFLEKNGCIVKMKNNGAEFLINLPDKSHNLLHAWEDAATEFTLYRDLIKDIKKNCKLFNKSSILQTDQKILQKRNNIEEKHILNVSKYHILCLTLSIDFYFFIVNS